MDIDKEEAVEDFRNFLEIPLYGKAIYLKMREYKDAIAININEFKNLVKLRNMVKKTDKKWQKTSNDLDFEIVNTRGIWIAVLPGKNDIEPSRIIPPELIKYIVKEADNMDFKIINRRNNLTIPGLEGKLYDIWFEKIREDYISGIIKNPKIEPKINYEPEVEEIRDELKKIDFEKMFEIFSLMFEDIAFRKEIYKALQLWKTLDLKVL